MDILTEILAPQGANCRPGYALSPQYITIHNTANRNPGANAKSHAAYLRGTGATKYVSYHYAVDDRQAVRIIPDCEVAWHAGDGAKGLGNRQSLAIEICENPESDLRIATDNAAMLCAILMHTYQIPLQNVVQHNRWSGKNCPARLRAGQPYDWMTFIAKVSGYLSALQAPQKNETLYTVQTGAFRSKENAAAYAETLRQKGVEAFVAQKEVQ